MRRFRAVDLPEAGGEVMLDEGASHHLLRVTGIGRGEAVELFDGSGRRALARLDRVEAGRAVLDVEPASAEAPRPARWLLVSLVKHDAFDLILRMATELGASHIVHVLAARSVARGERADRWARILESAAAQCGRADLPELCAPLGFEAALARPPAGVERRIYLPNAPMLAAAAGPVALLLGPEGGLTPEEVQAALAAGYEAEGLGPSVLRADTAVAAALARHL